MSKVWKIDEIQVALNNYIKKNNRTPKCTEWKSYNGLPSWAHATKIIGEDKVLGFYNKIGIEMTIHQQFQISDSELKNECLNLFKVKNRMPTKEEIENNSKYSTHPFYRYGTLEDTFVYFNILKKKKIKTDNEIILESISEINRISNILEKSPTVYEYNTIRETGFPRRTLEKKLSLSWNEILSKYSAYALNIKKYTKDELKEIIINFIEENNYIPNSNELIKFNLPSYTSYETAFGMTYNQFLEYLGYSGLQKSRKPLDDNALLKIYRNLFDELGDLPSSVDFKARELPSYSTFLNRFGSIDNICDKLKIDINKYTRLGLMGKICTDKNGDICRSYKERDITNFLIDSRLLFEKEYLYSKIINTNKKYAFDWVIKNNNNIYYVEYFGLYGKNSKSKIVRNYNKRVDVKIKLIEENNILEKCILIFPEDYDKNSLEDIFEVVLK